MKYILFCLLNQDYLTLNLLNCANKITLMKLKLKGIIIGAIKFAIVNLCYNQNGSLFLFSDGI